MDEGDESLAIYALSYDPVSTLSRFAESHGVTYPLLSDADSRVITELGILNVTMEQERAAYDRKVEDRHQGLPYPGSFVLDEDGVLVGKRLEQSHRIRPTANTLLETFFESGETPAGASVSSSPGVSVAAWLDTEVVSANQIQHANVRLVLEPSFHIYTEPVPEGFEPVTVTLAGDSSIRVEDVDPLPGHEFSITGLDEEFFVLEGTVDIQVPFFLLTNRDTAGDGARDVPLTVEINYQACNNSECFMPERVSLPLRLTEEPNPGYETKDAAAVSPLVMRRVVEGPKTEAELLDLVNAALTGVQVNADDIRATVDALVDKGLLVPDGDRWAEAK